VESGALGGAQAYTDAAVRRVLLILSPAVAALAVLIAVPIAGATLTRATVHVRPATGGSRTAFAISVRIPAQTGTFGALRRSDSLTATGPSGRGCVASTEMPLPAAAAGATVRLRLVPGRRPARWCAGTFHGVITQSEAIRCGGPPQQIACPMLMIRPQTIGRFRFVVRRG
jgi:hypothetical protein